MGIKFRWALLLVSVGHSFLIEAVSANSSIPESGRPLDSEQSSSAADFYIGGSIAVGISGNKLLVQGRTKAFSLHVSGKPVFEFPALFNGDLVRFNGPPSSLYSLILTKTEHGLQSGVYNSGLNRVHYPDEVLVPAFIRFLNQQVPANEKKISTSDFRFSAVSGKGDVLLVSSEPVRVIHVSDAFSGKPRYRTLPDRTSSASGTAGVLFSPTCLTEDGNVAAGEALVRDLKTDSSIHRLMVIEGLKQGRLKVDFIEQVDGLSHDAIRCFSRSESTHNVSSLRNTLIYSLVSDKEDADNETAAGEHNASRHRQITVGESVMIRKVDGSVWFEPYRSATNLISTVHMLSIEPSPDRFVARTIDGNTFLSDYDGKRVVIPKTSSAFFKTTDPATGGVGYRVFFNTGGKIGTVLVSE